MATVIKLKRSETASSVPQSTDLQVGELAINTADKKIYVKDSGNNIIEVANQTTGATVDDATALAIALG